MFKLKKGEFALAANGVGSANNLFFVTSDGNFSLLTGLRTAHLRYARTIYIKWNYTWSREVDSPKPLSRPIS
jgi:hypothetical protein